MRFEGKVALVTGGGSGIGEAAALQFGREGARVVVADIALEHAQRTAEAIAAGGGEALAVSVDVADEDSVASMVGAAIDGFGRLDAALNNAGISDPPRPFVELSAKDWQRMIDVNLSGVFYCMKHEIKAMLAQEPVNGLRGSLCATSSGAGRMPAPGQPHYTAAKHGMLGIVKLAAQEHLKQGIRSNAILPGSTDTPMMHRNNPKEAIEQMRRFSPGGELGNAAELGHRNSPTTRCFYELERPLQCFIPSRRRAP